MSFTESVTVRLHEEERKLINKAVEKDEEVDNENQFIRICVLMQLRKRFPNEMEIITLKRQRS